MKRCLFFLLLGFATAASADTGTHPVNLVTVHGSTVSVDPDGGILVHTTNVGSASCVSCAGNLFTLVVTTGGPNSYIGTAISSSSVGTTILFDSSTTQGAFLNSATYFFTLNGASVTLQGNGISIAGLLTSVNNLGVSTGTLRTLINQVGVDTGTIATTVATSTNTLQTNINNLKQFSLAITTGGPTTFIGNAISSTNINATILFDSATTKGSLLATNTYFYQMNSSSVTLQANAFNGASQLVQLNGSTQYPAVSGALITSLTGANVTGIVPSSVLPSSVVYTTQSSSVTINNDFGVSGKITLPMTHTSSTTFQGLVGIPSSVNTQLTMGSSATVQGNLGVQGQVNQPLTVASSSTLQGVVGIPSNVNTQLTVGSSETVQGNFGVQGQVNQPLTIASSVTVTGGNAVQIASNTILSGTTFYQGGNVVIGALTASRCVQTDANNNLSVAAGACASGGTPATPNTSVQYNNAGAFGGSANFQWNGTSVTLVGPAIISTNTILPGTTIYQNGSIINSGYGDFFGAQSATFTITGNLSTLGGVYFSSQTSNGTAGKITANYTTGVTDHVIFASAPVAGLTVTLNYSTNSIVGGSGQVIQITKVDKSTYSVTIKVSGSDLIAGTTGLLTLNAPAQTDELISDGNGFWWPHGQGIQATPLRLYPNQYAPTAGFTVAASSVEVMCPLYIPVPVTVTGFTYSCQTAPAGSKVLFGILDTFGKVIFSTGPVAAATGAQLLLTNPQNLAPGAYYIAYQSNLTTTIIDGANANSGSYSGCSYFNQTGALAIASMTPAANNPSGGSPAISVLVAGPDQLYR